MSGKIRLYYETIKYLKPGQLFWRPAKRLGIKCALHGVCIAPRGGCRPILKAEELEHDPVFLARFPAGELMADKVTFLHESERFCWDQPWHIEERSHLWNFNLHYFEFLHPLVKGVLETGRGDHLDKTVQMIRGWIKRNPASSGGDGWSAYTISLRLTNWMAYYSAVRSYLDTSFREELEASIYEQYCYLSTHLEKDILGNHYFENLKTLVLCALFFDDRQALAGFLKEFLKECGREILPDGMHFELSPMYHKIVLEGMLRVAVGLREAGSPNDTLEKMVSQMIDAAFSMERGLSRTPLFNDSGDNVAKPLEALLKFADTHLGITPTCRDALPDSGYYFFSNGPWRLVVDAGAAGPDYIPGHSHCDAMSFELYRNGEPWLVNCGTYAYQCQERRYFRSTEAHNTVQVAGVEQSEIWSAFRLARRSRTKVLEVLPNGLTMEMTDYLGHRIQRQITLDADALHIKDWGDGLNLQSHVHSIHNIDINSNGQIHRGDAMYAPAFGLLQKIHHITMTASGRVETTIALG